METMTLKNLSRQQKLEIWAQCVRECRNSGMSVTKWCVERGINVKTYYYWQQRVFNAVMEQQSSQRELETLSSGATQFAELPEPMPEEVQTLTGQVIATLRTEKATLDIYAGASAEIVATLCRAMRC